MHGPISRQSVQVRLRWINGLFVVSGLVAILGFWQVINGAALHQHNFKHVKHNDDLRRELYDNERGRDLDPRRLRAILTDIRAQPAKCLAIVGPLERAAMRLAHTYQAVDLCVEDLALADETLDLLDRYEAGAMSRERFLAALARALEQFLAKSAAFEPLVERTVNFVFVVMLALLIINSLCIAIAGLWLGRGITRSYAMLETARRQAARLSSDLEVLFDSVPVRIWMTDKEGRVLRENRLAREAGSRPIGHAPDGPGGAVPGGAGAASPRVEVWECADGTREWLQIRQVPYRQDAEEHLLTVATDVTESQRDREALAASEERYDRAVSAASSGIFDWDVVTNDVFFSKRNFELLAETDLAEVKGFRWWEERVHADDLPRVMEALTAHLEHGVNYDETYRIRHACGDWRWWRSQGRAQRDETGRPIRMVGTNSDITELVEAQVKAEAASRAVEFEATHDALTGLPNRRFLNSAIAALTQGPGGPEGPLTVAHVDLDKFKEINDTLGHDAGDTVLEQCAQVLVELLEDGEFAARIGGDEFLLVSTQPNPEAGLWSRFCHLIGLLQKPIIYDGKPCLIGASLGSASGTVADYAKLLQQADLALYKAKNLGGNKCVHYDETLAEEVSSKKTIAGEIVAGLNAGEFFPVYELQIDAKTFDVVGVEALARWRHPRRGVLSPADFLPVAEDLGITPQLDDAILRKAVKDMEGFERMGLVIPRVSLNVSAKRLSDPNLSSGLPNMSGHAFRIGFELLETAFLDELNNAVKNNLALLRAKGVDIEIDDFGTGHASITSVMRVRPDRIKVDRSLIQPITQDPDQRRIVKSIVDIGLALGIRVLAEGVETMEHAAILRDLGCDALQGYAFCRPLEPEALRRHLVERPWGRAAA